MKEENNLKDIEDDLTDVDENDYVVRFKRKKKER